MLDTVCVVHLWTFLLYILIKGNEKPAKTNFLPAKLSAVLVSTESDSVLC